MRALLGRERHQSVADDAHHESVCRVFGPRSRPGFAPIHRFVRMRAASVCCAAAAAAAVAPNRFWESERERPCGAQTASETARLRLAYGRARSATEMEISLTPRDTARDAIVVQRWWVGAIERVEMLLRGATAPHPLYFCLLFPFPLALGLCTVWKNINKINEASRARGLWVHLSLAQWCCWHAHNTHRGLNGR